MRRPRAWRAFVMIKKMQKGLSYIVKTLSPCFCIMRNPSVCCVGNAVSAFCFSRRVAHLAQSKSPPSGSKSRGHTRETFRTGWRKFDGALRLAKRDTTLPPQHSIAPKAKTGPSYLRKPCSYHIQSSQKREAALPTSTVSLSSPLWFRLHCLTYYHSLPLHTFRGSRTLH